MKILRWKIKTYIKDRTLRVRDEPDLRQGRIDLLDRIDEGAFQKLVVFNGGIGFFAGSYQIFALTLTIPFIKFAYYYPSHIDSDEEILLRTALLLGALLGQLSFSFLADIYGRRKLYGYELMVLLLAIVGVAMSSSGQAGSMSIFGSLFSWRLVMGFGIGADYSLSASIAAEFAPTRHRARMIASMFYSQPLGYAFALLVTILVLLTHRGSIPHEGTTCDLECHQALDRCWRIIVGVGAIPALIAVYFRRTIPESPLYTCDVLNRPEEAEGDVVSLMDLPSRTSPVAARPPPVFAASASPSTGSSTLGALGGDVPDEIASAPASMCGPSGAYLQVPASASRMLAQISPKGDLLPSDDTDEDAALAFGHRWAAYWESFHKHFITKGHFRALIGVSVAWLCFDTAYYALLGSSATSLAPRVFNHAPPNCTLPTTTDPRTILANPFFEAPNCTTTGRPDGPNLQSIYDYLVSTVWEVCVLVCIGSLTGGAVFIYFTNRTSPRRVQAWGFLLLFFIFLIIGVLLLNLSPSQVTPAASIMYVLAGFVFEYGPNFTTYILPVELFPTKHRAFAHGIAAASGKAGASLFQLFVQYAHFGKSPRHTVQDEGTKWLGYAALCFMPAMVIGFFATVYLIPETRDEHGRNRRLDELELLGERRTRTELDENGQRSRQYSSAQPQGSSIPMNWLRRPHPS